MPGNPDASPEMRWLLLTAQAKAAGKTGDMPGVLELFRERVAQKNLPKSGWWKVGVAIQQMAGVVLRQGDQRAAFAAYEEAARYYREANDKPRLQAALAGGAEALIAVGDFQRALPLVAERTKLCREMGDRDALLSCLTIQVNLLHRAGDAEHAAEIAEQVESLARELGGDDAVAEALANRGLLLVSQNDLDQAQALLEQSELLLRKGTNRRRLANTIGSRALVLMQCGDNAGSLELQREAADICREVGDQEGLAKALAMQAMLLGQLGNPAAGVPLAQEADRLARSLGLTAMAEEMIAPVLTMLGAPAAGASSSAPRPDASPGLSRKAAPSARAGSARVSAAPAEPVETYDQKLEAWQKLPWLKRLRTPKPRPPASFKKDAAGFSFEVPSKPPQSIAEIRRSYEQQMPGEVAFESRFPLCDPQGRFLCKHCGADPGPNEWNIADATAAMRWSLKDLDAKFAMFVVHCQKCSKHSCYSPKEILTTHPGNPLGPWKKREIEVAKMSLTFIFNLSPTEIAAIAPSHLCEVFFLYH